MEKVTLFMKFLFSSLLLVSYSFVSSDLDVGYTSIIPQFILKTTLPNQIRMFDVYGR